LLGKICRKSNRKSRAMEYFKMSLRLDPFLWTSFQALAELSGGGGSNNRNVVSPDAVFGVEYNVSGPTGAAVATPTHFGGISSVPATFGGFTAPGTNHLQPPLQPVMTTPVTTTASQSGASASAAGSADRFQYGNYPPSTSFAPHRHQHPHQPLSGIRGNNQRFNLETPGLTPIAHNNSSAMMNTTLDSGTPFGHASISQSPFVSTPLNTTTTPQYPAVLRRARDVAARQYYPPSPETPVTHVTRSMRYLRGLGTAPGAGSLSGAGAGAGAAANTTSDAENRRDNNNNTATVGGRSLFPRSGSELLSSSATTPLSGPSLGIAGNTGLVTNHSTALSGAESEDVEKPATGKDFSSFSSESKVTGILELLSLMGAAYQKVCNYQCREALQLLQALPPRQQTTGWVLNQQGRAYLELNDFQNAQRCLEQLQDKDPGRIQGLELLSTVYWQLKKEVELAYLSQRVVDMDRLSPEAWCVVGNCFSLQKDHESALVFFNRSLQLDSDFCYTHTLSGYEYMANEDFDAAIACFRQAMRIDERHYNAWYGLGAIYHRQEKYELAVYHFKKAVEINPSSSVLRCNLGIAQHANGNSYEALETLDGAFRLDPRNPQARFQRATIYSSLNRPEEALEELRKVRDAAPREATIHFAMGKVLKRLGRAEEALKCFLTALDLDPKDNQMIKSAMDKLDEPEVDEETMGGF